jgi:hypothetical protein
MRIQAKYPTQNLYQTWENISPSEGWYVFDYIKKTSYRIEKIYLHIPPWAPHTYDFLVLIPLTHPRKILFLVLKIRNKESQILNSTLTYTEASARSLLNLVHGGAWYCTNKGMTKYSSPTTLRSLSRTASHVLTYIIEDASGMLS